MGPNKHAIAGTPAHAHHTHTHTHEEQRLETAMPARIIVEPGQLICLVTCYS